jgi:hypothetical protein
MRAGWVTGEAECLCGLAEIARLKDEDEDARELFLDARVLYERAGHSAGVAKCDAGLRDVSKKLCVHAKNFTPVLPG